MAEPVDAVEIRIGVETAVNGGVVARVRERLQFQDGVGQIERYQKPLEDGGADQAQFAADARAFADRHHPVAKLDSSDADPVDGSRVAPDVARIAQPADRRSSQAPDVKALLQRGPQKRVSLYEDALRKWSGEMAKFDKKRTDPAAVADIVFKALSARRPRHRYSVGHMAKAAHILEAMPQSVADWILKKRI